MSLARVLMVGVVLLGSVAAWGLAGWPAAIAAFVILTGCVFLLEPRVPDELDSGRITSHVWAEKVADLVDIRSLTSLPGAVLITLNPSEPLHAFVGRFGDAGPVALIRSNGPGEGGLVVQGQGGTFDVTIQRRLPKKTLHSLLAELESLL